ncbi:putative homocysteine s-methyltransferase [Diaporthe ampelina]|uniref:Putative homocysteine s-methyltransferase n=1 Tax=Diaporthe ampelina TaxID=1214573 RepID=A0A0G2FQU4_9PEZI|nr:putative homocysteine s-methyltransferase [Diaporthe ampelina]
MTPSTPVLFLDGGLGTSLEDKYGVKFSSKNTPLWSSHPVVSDPQTLLACQRDFGQVPVDVIETATYQVSVAGFAATKTETWPNGIDVANIPGLLKQAVGIADQARGKPDAKLALSLGPYGSTMVPGQEYSGAYDDEHNDEARLLGWWTQRLSLFGDDQVLDKIAYIACETIPRLDEIAAVRKAVAGFASKPLWISCVFPGEGEGFPDGSSVEQIVDAMLSHDDAKAQPWGIGINCTKMHKLSGLVGKYEDAVSKMIQQGRLVAWPALVLYPDGTNGEVYNTTTQKWEAPAGQAEQKIPWEQSLGQIVLDTARRQKWRTILVGGCCKASHSDIRKLVDFIHSGDVS